MWLSVFFPPLYHQFIILKTTTCKILHIDDDPDDHQMLESAIYSINSNSEIITALNGEEGIERLQLMKDENDLPALIVLDINMPKINGRDACVRVKKDEVLAGIPMIIYSTSNSVLDRLFFQGKNVEYITKPTDYNILLQLAGKMLDYCR
jgi:CheY-like chemotaxis protein